MKIINFYKKVKSVKGAKNVCKNCNGNGFPNEMLHCRICMREKTKKSVYHSFCSPHLKQDVTNSNNEDYICPECIVKNQDNYSSGKTKEYTYEQFKKCSSAFESQMMYKGNKSCNKDELLEMFWNIVNQKKNPKIVLDGVLKSSILFDVNSGDGHGTASTTETRNMIDLNTFISTNDSIFQYVDEDLSKINKNKITIEMLFSTLSWNVNDNYFYILNNLYSDCTKKW